MIKSRLFPGALKRSFPRMDAGASTTNRPVSGCHADTSALRLYQMSRYSPLVGPSPPLLGRWAPYHLDEVVQPDVPGKRCLHLIGIEFVILLRREDRFIQRQTDDRPPQ